MNLLHGYKTNQLERVRSEMDCRDGITYHSYLRDSCFPIGAAEVLSREG